MLQTTQTWKPEQSSAYRGLLAAQSGAYIGLPCRLIDQDNEITKVGQLIQSEEGICGEQAQQQFGIKKVVAS